MAIIAVVGEVKTVVKDLKVVHERIVDQITSVLTGIKVVQVKVEKVVSQKRT